MTGADVERLVVRIDRGKTLIALSVMVALAAFLGVNLYPVLANSNIGTFAYLGGPVLILAALTLGLSALLVFAVIAGHVVSLVRPPHLVLTPQGLEIFGSWGRAAVAWQDIEAIEVGYDRRRYRRFVGFRYFPGAGPRGSTNGALQQTIGFGWPGPPEHFARQLEEWHLRYG